MVIAKAIVKGIGENLVEVLYHYYKHDKKEVKDTIDWLRSDFKLRIENSKQIPELMAIEGEAWARFYFNFKYFSSR